MTPKRKPGKPGRPPNDPHELHVNIHIPQGLIPAFMSFKTGIVEEFGIEISNGIVVTALIRRALLDWIKNRNVKMKGRKS